jgi:hypothetical protein
MDVHPVVTGTLPSSIPSLAADVFDMCSDELLGIAMRRIRRLDQKRGDWQQDVYDIGNRLDPIASFEGHVSFETGELNIPSTALTFAERSQVRTVPEEPLDLEDGGNPFLELELGDPAMLQAFRPTRPPRHLRDEGHRILVPETVLPAFDVNANDTADMAGESFTGPQVASPRSLVSPDDGNAINDPLSMEQESGSGDPDSEKWSRSSQGRSSGGGPSQPGDRLT